MEGKGEAAEGGRRAAGTHASSRGWAQPTLARNEHGAFIEAVRGKTLGALRAPE